VTGARQPRVSVVIPTYRHRDFVLPTLQSVFNQTMQDYEIIVVNDGSPDDTGTVLAPFVESGRIRYFEQLNQGQSHARNAGIDQARGEYIALLDDDDLWPPDKLEWQLEFLERHADVGMVAGTLQRIDERGDFGRRDPWTASITFESLFRENPFLSPGQTLIRARLLKELGGMNAAIWGADDWDLWFRVAKVARIMMLDRLALYYRIHKDNASKQTARLLAASCATLETHLRNVEKSKRRQFRFGFHRTAYLGLGGSLTRAARDCARHGDVLGAVKALKGLLPLWRGLLFDPEVRINFIRDVRWG
jgi:glycosyltransferase involved in cell wall biosynthesis